MRLTALLAVFIFGHIPFSTSVFASPVMTYEEWNKPYKGCYEKECKDETDCELEIKSCLMNAEKQNFDSKVARRGNDLIITLENKQSKIVCDAPPEVGNGCLGGHHFYYVKYFPEIHQHLVYYDINDLYDRTIFSLVGSRNGEITNIDGWPVVSPDGKYFVTINPNSVDSDLVDEHEGEESVIQIWDISDWYPTLVWSQSAFDTLLAHPVWVTSESIEFTQHYSKSSQSGLSGKAERCVATVTLYDKSYNSWRFTARICEIKSKEKR
ncbi:MAG: hypothetical protein ACKVN9_06725 [Methylophilaceae bacterium]